MNKQILERLPKAPAPACICLERIGDNGPCPEPGHTRCDDAMLFTLEDGSKFCMNCGGDHE